MSPRCFMTKTTDYSLSQNKIPPLKVTQEFYDPRELERLD